MNRKFVLIAVLMFVFSVTLGAQFTTPVRAEETTLYISSDYTFTHDIYEPIVVNADNIVIDGNGYTLQGAGSGYGFNLNGRSNVTIKNVTVQGWDYGIWLYYSSNYNCLSGNDITDNENGVAVSNSSHNNVSGNNIAANSLDGIWLGYSSSNRISGNNITNNYNGIVLYHSSNNVIYHNNIIDNVDQAYDINPANNNWHHPDLLEGNYWSDYPGVDDGSGTGKHAIAGDGIGDTDIPWPGPDYDYYPFTEKNSWTLLWHKTYGGTDNDEGRCVAQTTDGGYIIVGWTESYGAGSRDVLLIKTDENGEVLWSKTYGGIYDDDGTGVAQTTDGGYIISGYTWSYGAGACDVWLIKTDENGNALWNKTYGGTYWDRGWSVAQTTDGG